MEESEFHLLADAWLESAFEQVEDQDFAGQLEIDLENGILAIEAKDGRQFLVSKHAPSRELWFSSPFSGGLHFAAEEGGRDWKLPDGRRLSVVLSEEIEALTGAPFEIFF